MISSFDVAEKLCQKVYKSVLIINLCQCVVIMIDA